MSTDRTKLAKALREYHEAGWYMGGHESETERCPGDDPRAWCGHCLVLAAADLLSEEGEPDCYLVEIQRRDGEWRKVPVPYGRDPRFDDRSEAMGLAQSYRVDGIPVRVRALYPGPSIPPRETTP